MISKTKKAARSAEAKAAAKAAMKAANAAKKAQLTAEKMRKAREAAALPSGDPVTSSPVPAQTNTTAGSAPTTTLATELQAAFDHFNQTLFSGALPHVMIRVERLKKYKGYFKSACWGATVKDADTHEIVMNPILFRERKLVDTLSTLVHEMVHLQDHANGTAPKRAYHGKSWVALMHAVGLTPVIRDAKGKKTGKETGVNSTHTIVEGGPFAVSCAALLDTGYVLTWSCAPEPAKPDAAKKKAGAKAKHECPECSAKAWGKPSMVIMCTGDTAAKHDAAEMECDREAFGVEAPGSADDSDDYEADET